MTVRGRKQFKAGHSVPKGLMLMLSAVLHSSVAFAQEARVLKPDLAFHMRCSERDQTAFEKQIESYLTSQRFRVLNLTRIQKEHGYFISNFHMIALDEADRILEIQSLPYDENLYAASLITKPRPSEPMILKKAWSHSSAILLNVTSNKKPARTIPTPTERCTRTNSIE